MPRSFKILELGQPRLRHFSIGRALSFWSIADARDWQQLADSHLSQRVETNPKLPAFLIE
jgi:hypothetical protein